MLVFVVGRHREDAHTIGLGAKTGADLASVLEVNVPALRLAGLVLQGEGVDALGLLNGILAIGFVGERLADGVESGRGGELVYFVALVSGVFVTFSATAAAGIHLPFLKDIVAD